VNTLLAYIPFVHPLNILLEGAQDWWYLLLVPLAFGISVIYKAMRVEDLSSFWRQVAVMTVQIVLGMIGLAIVLIIFVQVIIPMLPAEAAR
jgi:hypothetical protein